MIKTKNKQGLPQEIIEAQEQKTPTRADIIQAVNVAMLNNPNRKRAYAPDFRLCEKYLSLKAEKAEAEKSGDWKKAQKLSDQMLSVQIEGTFTSEQRQAEIDKTLNMPVAEVLEAHKKYEKIILECEEKIDGFDTSLAKAKIATLEEKYKKEMEANNGKWVVLASIKAEFNDAVEQAELEYITKPLNDLKIKRYEAKERFFIFDARIKYYISANKPLIEEEIENAKRLEIQNSLLDLVEYMDGGKL